MATQLRCIKCDVLIRYLDNTFDDIQYGQCEKHQTPFGVLDEIKPGENVVIRCIDRFGNKNPVNE